MRRVSAVLFLAISMLFGFASIAFAEKRVALVIGNSAYQNVAELRNPKNDAEAMSAKLTSLGFEVVNGIDLDLNGMRKTVRSFIRKLDGAKLALFFYAGHGLQVNGRNYMAPIDASLATYDDLDFETVPISLVLSAMERNAKTNMVFLDACRNNPLAENLARSMGTRSAAVGRGLARIGSGVGTFVSFSTQPGNVALDGEGKNSPFTSALVKHLGAPGEDISRSMIRVRREVISKTNGMQVPWEHSSLTGDVVLKEAVKTVVPKIVVVPIKNKNEFELAYWDSIKNSTRIQFFESYLKRYPNGEFNELATLKIEVIKESVAQEAARVANIKKEAADAAIARQEADKAATIAKFNAAKKEQEALSAKAAKSEVAEQKKETEEKRIAELMAANKEMELAIAKAADLKAAEEKRISELVAANKEMEIAIAKAVKLRIVERQEEAAKIEATELKAAELKNETAEASEAATKAKEKEKIQLALLKSTVPDEVLTRETTRNIQRELNRLGCGAGNPDGIWGKGSKRALRQYGKYGKVKLASLDPSNDLLDQLKAKQARVCPLVCRSGFEKKGKQCVRTKREASLEKNVTKKTNAKKPGAKSDTNLKQTPAKRTTKRNDKICFFCKTGSPFYRKGKNCAELHDMGAIQYFRIECKQL